MFLFRQFTKVLTETCIPVRFEQLKELKHFRGKFTE